MPPPTRKRPKSGDIIEVVMPHAFAYLQYVGKHATNGHAIRVFARMYRARPTDFRPLVTGNAYITFYPLGASLSQGITTIVGNVPLPQGMGVPTVLRRECAIDPGGKIRTWLIDDENGTTVHRTLNADQIALPIAESVNHEMLINDICSGWRPQYCVEYAGRNRKKTRLATGLEHIRHGMRFPSKATASNVSKSLRDAGYIVDDTLAGSASVWPIVVEHFRFPGDDTVERSQKLLRKVADEHGGQYLGLLNDGENALLSARSPSSESADESSGNEQHNVDHYLYFPKKSAATAAAKALKEEGYATNVDRSALGDSWLLLATRSEAAGDPAAEEARESLEQLAQTHGGEYDGWETEVSS